MLSRNTSNAGPFAKSQWMADPLLTVRQSAKRSQRHGRSWNGEAPSAPVSDSACIGHHCDSDPDASTWKTLRNTSKAISSISRATWTIDDHPTTERVRCPLLNRDGPGRFAKLHGMASQRDDESVESRVAKLRLEIERRLADARRLAELAANSRARARQLQEEVAQIFKVSVRHSPDR